MDDDMGLHQLHHMLELAEDEIDDEEALITSRLTVQHRLTNRAPPPTRRVTQTKKDATPRQQHPRSQHGEGQRRRGRSETEKSGDFEPRTSSNHHWMMLRATAEDLVWSSDLQSRQVAAARGPICHTASTTILSIHLDSTKHLAMGVNDLWDMLEPAATMVPIVSLALSDRYIGPAPHSPYVVGIDASGWFEQCQQGKWHRAHVQTGMNPALRTFLFRLSRLARYPVKLIFCYDGDQRPKIKRGHRVSTKDHWMVDPTQRILNVFNTQWLTAAGEAEAQLGLMNRAGVIDAVMTDDSDVFVFGAHTVLRNSTFSTDATIKLYTTSSIQELVEPRLTGDAFTTIAVCCGGDYDKKGLPGCGRETALGLVRCMDTSTLCDASLQRWRDAARHHLMSDPTDLYVKPAVTPLVELPVLHSPAPPDLAPLALLIHNLLGWDAKKLVSAFRSTVWPVVVLHEVLEDLAKNSPASDEVGRNFVFTCSLPLPQVARG
ncbi:PIN domain-like protein [Suillus occidentalis]|nr:PIN domain-like protein [Suillus occidentalis]